MMRLVLVIFVALVLVDSPRAFGFLYDEVDTRGQNPCSSCNSDFMSQVLTITEPVYEELRAPLPGINRIFNSQCLNFIDSQGKPGPWGKRALQAIDDIAPECFYERMDVSNVCPNYTQFNQQQKEHFWLWVFASMAQDEASCRPEVKVRATNGIAQGLFQLEYSVGLRRGSGRDRRLCRTGGPADTSNLDFQVECGVSIFRDIHCSVPNPRLVYGGSYWEKLRRPGGHRIGKLIRMHPLCGGR